MADNFTPLAVKTKTDGDVAIDIAQYLGATAGASNAIHVQPGSGATFVVDSELPAAAALTDNFANPTAPAVGAFAMVWDGTTWDRAPGTSADGLLVNLGANNDVTVTGTVTVDSELPAAAALADNAANPTAPAVGAFGMVWDGATWDRMPGTSADGVLVNLGTNNDVTVTGTVTVDSELPAAAALADDTANPTVPGVGSFLMGYHSGATNWNRVEVDDDGHLQVDILSGGGGAPAPTTPVMDPKTSAALAAGGSVDVDSTDVGAATKKLTQLVLTSSTLLKCVLSTVANGTPTTRAYFFVPANDTIRWDAPHPDFVQQGPAGAGFDGFRVSVTNLHDTDAADVYATFVTQE